LNLLSFWVSLFLFCTSLHSSIERRSIFFLLAKTFCDINLIILFIEDIHFQERNGTTCLLPASTRDVLLWPHVTKLLVWQTLPIVWEVVFLPSPSLTATMELNKTPGERWSSKLTRLRALTATLIFTEWTSQEIMLAQWSKSGTLSLKPSSKPRLPMVSFLECSVLLLPKRLQSKLKLHATPKLPMKSSLEKRWWRLCKLISRNQISKI